MNMPMTDVASATKTALRPLGRGPELVVPELLGASAEAYLSRQLHGNEPVEWKEPPSAEIDTSDLSVPQDALALLDDLDRLRTKEDAQPLSTFIPRGTTAESFVRDSLLPLLDHHIGAEWVAARLSSMNLELRIENGDIVLAA